MGYSGKDRNQSDFVVMIWFNIVIMNNIEVVSFVLLIWIKRFIL